jgi:hypothetical protein
VSVVPDYSSAEETVDGSGPPPSKKARTSNTWIFFKKFAKEEEALAEIKTDDCWLRHYTRCNTMEGRKVFYRCKYAKARGEQCAIALFLLYESNNESVSVFKNDKNHNHSEIKNKAMQPIGEEVLKLIEKSVKERVKPKALKRKLTESGLEVPSNNQLRNVTIKIKQTLFGSQKISIGELEAFLTEKSEVPQDEDTAFIVGFEIEKEDNVDFKFFVSTKRLLSNAINARVIASDATYKIVYQGYPLLMVGTTDYNKTFHHIGIALCTNENTDTFKFLFSTMKTALVKIHNIEMKPDYLIADGADSIKKAFSSVFEGSRTLMCWAHAIKKMNEKASRFCGENHKEIVNDVRQLQMVKDDEAFDKASSLFFEKWSKETAFCDYFYNEWFIQHRYWYLGAKTGAVPTTNNALEATNNRFKSEDTLRERIPLNEFKVRIIEIVSAWSKDYIGDNKNFAHCVTIKQEDYIAGHEWAKQNKRIQKIEDTDYVYLKIPSGNNEAIQESNTFESPTTFDDYMKMHFGSWSLKLPKHQAWNNGQCDCPAFKKNFICKHLIGVAARLKILKMPGYAKSATIGKKRKRGRPKQARRALLID